MNTVQIETLFLQARSTIIRHGLRQLWNLASRHVEALVSFVMLRWIRLRKFAIGVEMGTPVFVLFHVQSLFSIE